MCQLPVGAATEGLEVNRQCWYLNWTLKDPEEGHFVKFAPKKPAVFIKKTGNTENILAMKNRPIWLDSGKRIEVAKEDWPGQ